MRGGGDQKSTPLTRMHKGPNARSHFLGKGGGGYSLGVVLGRFPEKAWEGGVSVIANGNQYTR